MFALLEIFFRPQKVFARVRRKKNWVVPFGATVLLTLLTTLVVIRMVGMELMVLQRYTLDPKLTERVGGTRGVDHAIDNSNERVSKSIVLARRAGITIAALALIALAFTLAVRWLDPETDFFTMLAAVSFSTFPFALLSLVATWLILLAAPDPTTWELNAMPGLHLGRFLDRKETNPALFAIASGFDMMIFGEFLLMSFGLTKVSTLSYLQAFAISGAVWALAIIWSAALAVYL